MEKFYRRNVIAFLLFSISIACLLTMNIFGNSVVNSILWIFYLASNVGYLVWIFNDEWLGKYETLQAKKEKGYPKFAYPLVFLLLVFIVQFLSYNKFSTIYNQNKVITKDYINKSEQRKGFYDKMWKTYSVKYSLKDEQKATFVELAKMQMEARKDGQNVNWKFVAENTNIPYSVFSDFYAELSTYIEAQREEYSKLENECRTIAFNQNLLIDTFPNNWYNWVLKIEPIEYKFGFLSDSTNKVFNTAKEYNK